MKSTAPSADSARAWSCVQPTIAASRGRIRRSRASAPIGTRESHSSTDSDQSSRRTSRSAARRNTAKAASAGRFQGAISVHVRLVVGETKVGRVAPASATVMVMSTSVVAS